MSNTSFSFGPLSTEFVHQLKKNVREEDKKVEISNIDSLSGYSNEIVHVHMEDGRSIIVKRSPYDWAGPRFESARRASALLREKSTVVTPEHIHFTGQVGESPTLAYWFIPLPTLKHLWPELSYKQRVEVLHSLGQLLREVHAVRVDHYGPLNEEGPFADTISAYMEKDLRDRLEPAVWAKWPGAGPLVERLAQLAAELPEPESGPVLVHNDLHLGNIFCKAEGDKIRCVGLLDLEAAGGGRPESDLGSAIALHDPLFAEESGEGDWVEEFDRHLKEGYDGQLDSEVLNFFRVYHLLNLGFFSALSDDEWHASRVADAVRHYLDAM